jgi:hypothetical protein
MINTGAMKKLLIGFVVIGIYSCSHKSKDLVFDKLIGTWMLTDSSQYEQWQRNMDGSFRSRMFSIEGNDTAIAEEVSIYEADQKWHFKVTVNGQNKGEPVVFSSTKLTESTVQFENPEHDFPKLVNYEVLPNNHMRAFIASSTDTIYFNFKKLK